MTEPCAGCPGADTLLELALGELTGRERASALAHVADCAVCREQVQELVETTEQLLLAAPGAEPPAGFETAVLERLHADPVRRRRVPRVLAAAALVVILAVAGTVALATNDGAPEVAEAAMLTSDGRNVGRTWRYDGQPTWVLVSVPRWRVWDRAAAAPREYRLRATLDNGRTIDLGALAFAKPSGAWGTTTPVDATHIRSVSVVDTTGRVWCRGTF